MFPVICDGGHIVADGIGLPEVISTRWFPYLKSNFYLLVVVSLAFRNGFPV